MSPFLASRLLDSHTWCGSRPGNSAPHTQPVHGYLDDIHHRGHVDYDYDVFSVTVTHTQPDHGHLADNVNHGHNVFDISRVGVSGNDNIDESMAI